MMTLRDQLLTVSDLFAAHTGRRRSTLSNIIFTDGGRLDGIAAGRDLNTRSFERAMAWFSANWPADLDWPAEIARPAPIVPPLAERAAHEADPRCEA